jgi:hypothetical protein
MIYLHGTDDSGKDDSKEAEEECVQAEKPNPRPSCLNPHRNKQVQKDSFFFFFSGFGAKKNENERGSHNLPQKGKELKARSPSHHRKKFSGKIDLRPGQCPRPIV